MRAPSAAGAYSLKHFHAWSIVAGRVLALIGITLMMAIVLVTMSDIALRFLKLGSISGANEIMGWGVAIAVAATFCAGAAEKANLEVDVLAGVLPEHVQTWLHVIGAFLLLVFYICLGWCLASTALELSRRGAVTMFLRWPQAPFVWLACALVVASAFIQLAISAATFREALSITGVPAPHAGRRTATAAGALLAAALGVAAFAEGYFDGIASLARATPILTAAILTVVMLAAILFLVPIAAGMGLVGVAGAALLMGAKPAFFVLGSATVEYLSNPALAVLPLFLIMGSFAGVAGLSEDMYRLAHVLLGHRRGGLALATIAGCAGFGALSSSSIATSATFGQIALPEMRKRGYSPAFATGVVAAGGTLAPLLSPGSGPLVVYALLTEQSIGQLFVGAAIPALVAVALFWAVAVISVRVRPEIAPAKLAAPTWGDVGGAATQSWGVILLIVVVFGGIYGGVFTVTEAAAVGAGVAFLFALLRGKLSSGAMWSVMAQVTSTTAMIYFLLFAGVMFSYFIDYSGAPEAVTTFLQSLPLPPAAVVVLFVVFFLLLGCIMESYLVLLIVVPIVAPYIFHAGFSPIWWGIIMVGVVETGMILPPLGLNVLVLKNLVGGVPTRIIFAGVVPFIGADLVRLVLLLIFPALVTWLPAALK